VGRGSARSRGVALTLVDLDQVSESNVPVQALVSPRHGQVEALGRCMWHPSGCAMRAVEVVDESNLRCRRRP
jgi:hypothetical protein